MKEAGGHPEYLAAVLCGVGAVLYAVLLASIA